MADPQIRASDGEREQTVERLRTAAGEGRLTLEELADRIEAVADSRTRGELERATADLPRAEFVSAAAGGGGALAPSAATGVPTVPGTAQPATAAPLRNSSVFGDHERSGQWLLPASSRWDTIFGDVTLDLREALVPAGEIVIEARTIFGDVELLVPEGVAIEVRGRTYFGDVKQAAGMQAPAGAPRIVLTGSTVFGDVLVRARRLRERLAERLRAGRG